MMKEMTFLKAVSGFFIICFFSSAACGRDLQVVLSVESKSPLMLSVYGSGVLQTLTPPFDFMREVDGVYDEVYVKDLTGDGIGEVIFRLAGGGVNSCSRVLQYSSDHSLNELIFDRGGLCNFKVVDGYVVSSYRDGAAWVEDIYVVEGGKVNIKISDRCVGCDEVSRTDYLSDGSVIKSLVSDDVNFERRKPLLAKVISKVTGIYLSPAAVESIKRYLVKGQEVSLISFESFGSEEWVEVRVLDSDSTGGWLRCIDLDYCSGL